MGNVNNQPNVLVFKSANNGREWAIHTEYAEGTFGRDQLIGELLAMQADPTEYVGLVSINNADWVPVQSVDIDKLHYALFDAK